MLYAAKAIYTPPNVSCQSEIVPKFSENPLYNIYKIITNFHKITEFVLKNHKIAQVFSKIKHHDACLFVFSIPLLTENMTLTVHLDASCYIT